MKLTTVTTIVALACGATLTIAQTNAQEATPSASPSATQGPGGPGEGGRHGGGHWDSGKMLERLTKQLNLTSDEQTKIKGILDDADAKRKAVTDDSSLTPEQKHAKMKEIHENTTKDIEGALTPEQLTKFQEMQKEHGHHQRSQ